MPPGSAWWVSPDGRLSSDRRGVSVSKSVADILLTTIVAQLVVRVKFTSLHVEESRRITDNKKRQDGPGAVMLPILPALPASAGERAREWGRGPCL